MSRELIDKIIAGDYAGAKDSFEDELNTKLAEDIEIIENLFAGKVDEYTFSSDEELFEELDESLEDMSEEDIDELDEDDDIFRIVDELDERELIGEDTLDEKKSGLVKRVRSRNNRKVIRKKNCPPGFTAKGTRCVKIGGAQKVKMRKGAKKASRKKKTNVAGQRKAKKIRTKTLRKRVQLGLKKTR